MGNFEFKLQTPEAKTVDLSETRTEIVNGFAAFKEFATKKLNAIKAEIENSQTLAQAKKIFESTAFYIDPAKLTLTVGDSTVKAKDEKQFQEYKNLMDTKLLPEASKELSASEKLKKMEVEAEISKTSQESKVLESDVKKTTTETTETKTETKTEDKTASTSSEKTETKEATPEYPTYSELTLLQAAYARHPEYAKERSTTREEERLKNLTEKYQDA